MECRPADTFHPGVIQGVEPLTRRGVCVSVPADIPDIRSIVGRPDRPLLPGETVTGVEPRPRVQYHHLVLARETVRHQRPRRPRTHDTDVGVRHG